MLCTDTLTLSCFHSPPWLCLSSASTQSFSVRGPVQPAEYEGQVRGRRASTSLSQSAKRVTEASTVCKRRRRRLVRTRQVLLATSLPPLRPPSLPVLPRRLGQSQPAIRSPALCLPSRSLQLGPCEELKSPPAGGGGGREEPGDPRHHLAEEVATLQPVPGGSRSAKPPPPPASLPLLASTRVLWLHHHQSGAITNTN